MKKKILWVLLTLFSTALNATQVTAALEPLPQQAEAARLAVKVLSHENYERLPLDEHLSWAIFNHYLKSLDPDKSIFLQSDIDQLGDARSKLGDALLNGDLHIPFAIFNLRQQRLAEHITYARSLLKHGFDFTDKESVQANRKNASRPKSEDELNDLWRKRVKNDWLRLKLAGKDDKSIVEILERRDDNSLKNMAKIKSGDVFQKFMDACALAYDPHTDYLGVRATEAFDVSMRLSIVGIGVELQYRDDYITISHLLPGGPSDLSGHLKVGDRILGIGQGENGSTVDVIGARIDDTADLIRGPEDSVVRLDILPAEAGPDDPHHVVSLVRKKISLEKRSAKKSIIKVQDGETTHQIGVIKLPAFYRDFSAQKNGDADFKSAARDVSRILDEFKNEAIELTGLFVDRGPVVQMQDSRERVVIRNIGAGSAAWSGPLGVLINHASASASEIFAAAIQD
jgi:carboxyl-terminal processing protease